VPFEFLLQTGLLVATLVTAFALSSLVGMLVTRVWAARHPLGRVPDDPVPSPSPRDPARDAPARPLRTYGLPSVSDPTA
jgi:hypothetical protein